MRLCADCGDDISHRPGATPYEDCARKAKQVSRLKHRRGILWRGRLPARPRLLGLPSYDTGIEAAATRCGARACSEAALYQRRTASAAGPLSSQIGGS